ncbi:MAG TPA: C45 family peptidase [bacterium]|nr:C45 family peptidase [bacterium]
MRIKKSALFFLALWVFAPGLRAEVLAVHRTTSGTGWLERTDQDDRVLHLEGSYYDMGVEQARLLGPDAEMAVRSGKNAMLMAYPFLPPSLDIRLIYKYVYLKSAPFVPATFKDELRGLSDASGVPFATIAALHAATFLTSCSGAAAWGPATADGKLYFIRSNDIAITIDPETGEAYHDRAMIVVVKPQGEIPYMFFSWPGFIGASDGMNAEGICVGNMSDPSRFETPAGLPMLFRLKQTLGHAHNLDEAIEWMTKQPYEGGYNFLVADGKVPAAMVIEMDARKSYVGGWDGPAESNHYTYKGCEYAYAPKEDLLTRTNHPLSAELIANHKGRIDDGKAHGKSSAQRYQDLRGRLAADYGRLDLERMYNILRDHYDSIEWEKGPTLGATSHQLAFDPGTGDFLIAVSHGNPLKHGRRAVSAFSRPYHHYNFFELLAREPGPAAEE